MVVAAGSAAVLAFLLSNIRYRKLELLADDEASTRPRISPVALVIQLLAEFRKEEDRLLCRIQLPGDGDLKRLADLLRKHTRADDVHTVVENGVVVSRLRCPADKAGACAVRWAALLKSNGFQQGSLLMWQPERDQESLLNWILKGDQQAPTGTLRVVVDVPQPSPEDMSGDSPAVDPVTGVLREDLVSRAIRRLLAERKRTREPVTMIRVNLQQLPEDRSRDEVMRGMADVLLKNCRESDLVGLSGALEFVLCLEGTLLQAEPAARRIAAELRARDLPGNFGLASMPDHGDSPSTLFERAGLALETTWIPGNPEVGVFSEEMAGQPDTGEAGGFGKEEF